MTTPNVAVRADCRQIEWAIRVLSPLVAMLPDQQRAALHNVLMLLADILAQLELNDRTGKCTNGAGDNLH